MAQPPIPEDIRRFVLTSIPSVPHLEALLLLRTEAEQEWPTGKVALRLYIGDKAAMGLMDDLCRAGMTSLSGKQDGQFLYRYQPASEALRATIEALAELYARRLVDVTNLIHSKLDRKAQQFADAFRLRKD
jgi:hypothetical protein